MKVSILIVCLMAMAMADSHYTDYNDTNWGGECDGMHQSPINIESKEVQFCPWDAYFGIGGQCQDFMYNETGQALTVSVDNLNYLWTVKFPDDQNMGEAQFRLYNSLQFQFHSPSEHTINGEHGDLEMQLFHVISNQTEEHLPENTDQVNYTAQFDGNQIAILAILFEEDEEIEEDVFDRFPEEDGMANLVKSFQCIHDEYFYVYQGSLTSPPCSEIVEWYIMRQPLPIRPQNLQRFRNDINNGLPNNRPVQVMYNRTVGIINGGKHCEQLNEMRLNHENGDMDNHTMS